MNLRITGGRVLLEGGLEETELRFNSDDGLLDALGSDGPAHLIIAADGLLVLPGIVDIHGDAFERQIMPRPGVSVSLDVALIDTDRQVIANGITTVFHGVTWSWEPGLRGPENARGILAALESLRPHLAADTRFHLRHEAYNLDAETEVSDWLDAHRIDLVAFNDHLPSPATVNKRPDKIGQMAERSGLTREDFLKLVERLHSRAEEVSESTARVARRATALGVPLLSHDDESPERRQWFRSLGCRVCEFPMNIETVRDAASAGDDIVLGAPNVMRGRSHMGWIDATKMVSQCLCSVLASDYYYPALTIAAFRLVEKGVAPLPVAWALVSASPAAAARLSDRGRIAPGLRADLVLIDPRAPGRPGIVAVVVAGRLVHLTEPGRLRH